MINLTLYHYNNKFYKQLHQNMAATSRDDDDDDINIWLQNFKKIERTQ